MIGSPMTDRVAHALDLADDPDELLGSAFSAAAGQVDVKKELAVIREIKGIGDKTALEILGKIALVVVRGN